MSVLELCFRPRFVVLLLCGVSFGHSRFVCAQQKDSGGIELQIRQLEGMRAAQLQDQLKSLESQIGRHERMKAEIKRRLMERKAEMQHQETNADSRRQALVNELIKLDHVAEELSQRKAELESRIAEELAIRRRQHDKPLPDDAALRIFHLKHSDAHGAAKLIEKILVGQPYRLAVDDRVNALILHGTKSLSEPVEALLTHIDRPAPADEKPSNQRENVQRTFQIHVYWLASKHSDESLRSPETVLPGSVIEALDRVGIAVPGLVSAVTSSFALAEDEHAMVKAVSRAMIGELPATLNFQGSISLNAEQAIIEARIDIQGAFQSEISGSIAAPLGDYVVLGTTDSLGSDDQPRDFGGREVPDKAPPSPARFGFVLQVVEAESFAPDSAPN